MAGPTGPSTISTQSTISTNPPSYTLTYDENGGSGSMAAQYGNSGNGYNLTIHDPQTFTRSGYVFSSFNTVGNGSGTSYDPGDSISITGNTTLYAQWSQTGNSLSSGGDTFYICITHPLDATKKTIVAYTTPTIGTNLNFSFTTSSPQSVSSGANTVTLSFNADSAPSIQDFSSSSTSWLTIDASSYTFSGTSGSFNVDCTSNALLVGTNSRTGVITYNGISNALTNSVQIQQSGNSSSYNENFSGSPGLVGN